MLLKTQTYTYIERERERDPHTHNDTPTISGTPQISLTYIRYCCTFKLHGGGVSCSPLIENWSRGKSGRGNLDLGKLLKLEEAFTFSPSLNFFTSKANLGGGGNFSPSEWSIFCVCSLRLFSLQFCASFFLMKKKVFFVFVIYRGT